MMALYSTVLDIKHVSLGGELHNYSSLGRCAWLSHGVSSTLQVMCFC